MAIKRYSDFPAAVLPLGGTELVPLMQGGVTVQTPLQNLPGSPFITGITTSTALIATYPPAGNGGRSAQTSDMGLMQCDGTRWLVVGTPPIPLGAALLGYKTNVYTVFPVIADITMTRTNPDTRLYNGTGLSATLPLPSYYATASNGQLQQIMPSGSTTPTAYMCTQNAISSQQLAGNLGTLPYLLGSQGFYVEYASTNSVPNNTDNWFSCFLMPQEHNTIHLDHKPSDPAGYEKWYEFDINENGFPPNFGNQNRGNFIYWFGNSSGVVNFTVPPTGLGGTLAASNLTDGTGHFLGDTASTWSIHFSDGQTHTATFTNGSNAVTWVGAITGTPTTAATMGTARISNSNIVSTAIDYSVEHIFGMSYDPIGLTCTWFVDGVQQTTISTAPFDQFPQTYHYYFIALIQSRGAFVPYSTNIRYFAAWAP
jgi:hypothetical protein